MEVTQTENYLKSLIDNSADAIITSDTNGIVTSWSKGAEKIYGYTEDEVLGKFLPMVPPVVEEIEDPNLGGTFVLSSSPLFDSSGNFIGIVHISRDITEIHTLREKIIQSERLALLGELAATVAHEIKKPLVSIGGFARRLEKKFTGDASEYARIIINEVNRLENILKEILGFAKVSKLIKSSININELVNDVVNFITPEIEIDERENKLIRELSASPIMTIIDRDRVKEAILNLITNANDATDHGTVTIKTRRKDNEAVIEISDTGCGIKEEALKNIFNPFFTTKLGGTGLGLAITRRIIEEHGGKIEAESEYGHGTTFKVYLPLEET